MISGFMHISGKTSQIKTICEIKLPPALYLREGCMK